MTQGFCGAIVLSHTVNVLPAAMPVTVDSNREGAEAEGCTVLLDSKERTTLVASGFAEFPLRSYTTNAMIATVSRISAAVRRGFEGKKRILGSSGSMQRWARRNSVEYTSDAECFFL